jgi:hypothetical protein
MDGGSGCGVALLAAVAVGAAGGETGEEASGVPHSVQKRPPGRLACPQRGQRAANAAPHASQNLAPAGLSAWQTGQSMVQPCTKALPRCWFEASMAVKDGKTGSIISEHGNRLKLRRLTVTVVRLSRRWRLKTRP